MLLGRLQGRLLAAGGGKIVVTSHGGGANPRLNSVAIPPAKTPLQNLANESVPALFQSVNELPDGGRHWSRVFHFRRQNNGTLNEQYLSPLAIANNGVTRWPVPQNPHCQRTLEPKSWPMRVSLHLAGAGWGTCCWLGVPKFTLGAWREPSEAAKYASLGLKPAHFAKMLLGNCWM